MSAAAGRVLVTGVNGFVGKHLVRELTGRGHDVVGTGREIEGHPEIADLLVDYISADLLTQDVSAPGLTGVVHLAGRAAVGASFDQPARYIADNTAMLVNVCEPLLRESSQARIVVVSTGAVYDSNQPMPIAEDGKIAFSSPYVVSKIAVENLALYYARRGLDTVIARPFNHIGPGQGPGFLVPDLISGVRAAAASGGPLRTGRLDTARDYTDVRDVVTAYAALLTAESTPGTSFNVASGRPISGSEIFAHLLALLGLQVDAEVDPALVRPGDPALIAGDAAKLRDAANWSPTLPIERTLLDAVATAG